MPLLPPRSESQRKGRAVHRPLTLRPPEARPHKRMGNNSWWKKDAIRVSMKDGASYAEILKAMKAKVNPQNSGAKVLSIRRTRKEEILLVLKKGGDVSAFEEALDQAH